MKLNNRGWGLQAMLVCILILMLFLIVTSISINKLFGDMFTNDKGVLGIPDKETKEPVKENKPEEDKPIDNKPEEKPEIIEPVPPIIEPVKKTYSDLEDEVKEATIIYQNNNYTDLVDGEKITVTIKNLKRENLIKEINDIEDNTPCTGYGMFQLKNGTLNYNVYLKCSNYTTNGYNEIYDVGY